MDNKQIKEAYEKEGGPERTRRASDDSGMHDSDMLKIVLLIAFIVIVLGGIIFQTGV